ncbi:MAG TPA: hypothetical protein VGR85_03115 [Candidatus Limnocylindria bacterium]|jgi:hypothetical protein|nr:hypothetical protein [Candidatus Limnocylindria bacterium]
MPDTVFHRDSFDFYATADIDKYWTIHNGSGSIGAFGRWGTNGLRCSSTVNGVYKTIAVGEATHFFGFSHKHSTNPGTRMPIVSLRDAGSLTTQVTVQLDTAGRITVLRGTGAGTLLGTGTTVFSISTERHVSCKIVISDTVGEVLVKVNGVTEINLTNQDTRNGTPTTADQLGLCTEAFTTSDNHDFDDFWWNNFADFGDSRVERSLPSGNGNSSQWVGSDGNSTDNYLLVDETAPNADTDYVASSTAGDIDLYAFANVTPTTGAVKEVSVSLFARKDDAGARSIATMVRDGGTNAAGATQSIGSTYLYYTESYVKNPVTTNDWTITEVNADEYGQKLVA